MASDTIKDTTVQRDDQPYSLYVKVEDTLFRVPKHELEEQSSVFRDVFSMPPPETGTAEGTSDENPICLDMVRKEDFKLLLQILYLPKMRDISSTLNVEQCVTLFDLSDKWGFEEVRLLVKKHFRASLWTTETVNKLLVALKYEIEEWYYDVYLELVTRTEPLSAAEMEDLGTDISAKVARVREEVREAVGMHRSRNKCKLIVAETARQAILTSLMPPAPPGKIVLGTQNAFIWGFGGQGWGATSDKPKQTWAHLLNDKF